MFLCTGDRGCMLTSAAQDIRWLVLWKEWQADLPGRNIFPPEQDIWHTFHTKQNSSLPSFFFLFCFPSIIKLAFLDNDGMCEKIVILMLHSFDQYINSASKLGILPMWTCQNWFFPPKQLWRILSGYMPRIWPIFLKWKQCQENTHNETERFFQLLT